MGSNTSRTRRQRIDSVGLKSGARAEQERSKGGVRVRWAPICIISTHVLGTGDRERESIHDDEGAGLELALHQAHHLYVPALARVHDHLQQRERRHLHVLEVVWAAYITQT